MTATAPPVKMAACPPVGGDGVDPDNFGPSCSLQVTKLIGNSSQGKINSSSNSAQTIKLDGEKAYDAVVNFDENQLQNFLEEVTSPHNKTDKSALAQLLIRKEEEALREESGSGEDTIEQALGRQRKKRSYFKRDQGVGSHDSGSSAAARNSTGGSLGSLHNLSDPKVPEQKSSCVASKSRAGGSCGNLSKGSFETHVCKRKSRRSRELSKASASQREGGSLQNLSKTEAASNEAKRLHKSGSLSQVFSDGRIKNRRQKTSSESSGTRLCRRSEDREAGESSDEEICGVPYQPLGPSSHSSISGHSVDIPDGLSAGMVGTNWDEEHLSDAASGETTEDDMTQSTARSKLGDYSRNHYLHSSRHGSESNDTELHTIITHTAHRDVLPTISSDSDVDKPINFSLNKNQDDMIASASGMPLLSCPTYVTSVHDGKSTLIKSNDDDIIDKKKLRSTKSDSSSSNSEKHTLDENGNPVLMAVRSSSNSSSTIASVSSLQTSTSDRHALSTFSRKNGFSGQAKDVSTYDRMKAKADKKKEKKERDVIAIEKTPGFCGDIPMDELLKYIGVSETSSSKSKKKNKGKKDESKDERDGAKKSKGKGSDRVTQDDSFVDKFKDSYASSHQNKEKEEGGVESKEKENRKSNGKKCKDHEKKRVKKDSRLRESSSVEDLVSKSKQSENVKDVRKQMTVDDGDLNDLSPYCHSKQPKEKFGDAVAMTSEFSYDFYKVGDATLEPNPLSSSESGDFEVVSRRRSKKSKNHSQTVSQAMRYGGSGGWNGNLTFAHGYSEDQRRSTFPRVNGTSVIRSSHKSSREKPQINFSEAPRTMHEGAFLSQWSGNRNTEAERGFPTSAPHSEDSDSDGGDSVQSMPAHTITPSSTDSTPQTSYANIAKLAAVTNSKAQGRKGNAGTSHPSVQSTSEEESEKNSSLKDFELQDSKEESNACIFDENFPPLTETLNTSVSGVNSKNNEKFIESAHYPSDDESLIGKGDTRFSSNSSTSDTSGSETSAKFSSSFGTPGISVRLSQNTVIINNTKFIVPPLQARPHSLPPPSTLPPQQPSNSPLVHKPSVPHSHAPPQVTAVPRESQPASQGVLSKETISVKPSSVNSQNCVSLCNDKEPSEKNKNSSCNKEVKTCSNKLIKSSKNNVIVENGNSRCKKFEAAVVFTDSAKFEHTLTDIEFGFDVSLDNLTNLTEFKVIDNNNDKENTLNDKPIESTNNKTDNNVKNLNTNKKDFSKLFQAPKNDVVSYNYEELCRHVSKAWETTLQQLQEDPKNIQYWKATESVNEVI